MRARLPLILAAILAFAAARPSRAAVSLCDLAKNPAAYDRQVIEITAFVSHGFEDFTLFDPLCSPHDMQIWLEYGGRFASGTIYCCGVGDERSRPRPMVVEGISIPVVVDANLKRFDQWIQRKPDSVVHATIRGHFFAGKKAELPGGARWTGYGHFSLFSLLTIEQILKVDPHDLRDVDYRAAPDSPSVNGVGCFSRRLGEVSHAGAIEEQRLADAGERARSLTDPLYVASDGLRRFVPARSDLQLRESRRTGGRIVYEATAPDSRNRYMLVVSRPYWLSFFAKDRHRVAWVVLAAYETGCRERERAGSH